MRPLNKYRHAKSIEDYFDQRVVKHSGYYDTSCWQFLTSGDKNGYKQVTGSKHCAELGLTRAHQVAWYVTHGEIPAGKMVCHTCDNPECVNPEHLFLGSPDDNVQDMMKKGRYKHPGATKKLSDSEVEDIKNNHKKQTCFQLAEKYNCSFSLICRVWRGEY